MLREIVFHPSLLTRFDFIPEILDGWVQELCVFAKMPHSDWSGAAFESRIADLIADFSLRGVGRARQRIH
jgi:hypothetical protein